ncbi:lysine--tRNA ligase [Candidatus Micrarchaeota archaeon]|nr:lysine--tRNA ligase [Candidatus Micrarchaeota archaeon]
MAINETIQDKIEKLNKLHILGINPYAYSFNTNTKTIDLHKTYDNKLTPEEKTNIEVKIAGRLMTIRRFGKLIFLDLDDGYGKIQLCAKQDEMKESFNLLDLLDRGDFIGTEGIIFKTKKGELSILIKTITLLTKSLALLPDKWAGLKDIDDRFRNRHVDLIINSETKEVFIKKAKILEYIRDFMTSKEFLEVETPILQPLYGGASARPFKTYSHAWKSDFYLAISPELYLKRLLIGGFQRVYTICKNFRNEDVDKTHNPEFTMLECYAAYWDYNEVMNLVEELYETLAIKLNNSTKVLYQGTEIDLKRPWTRITMKDALKKYAKLNVDELENEKLKELLIENKIELDVYKRGLAIAELFNKLCEPHLIQPTFVYDYPKETTGLCKLKRGDPELIERFEFFINGREQGNAYSELTDPKLQEKFFTEQKNQGKMKGEQQPIDVEFIHALEYGMPPAGGLGIGVDRIIMLFTDSPSIREVILFPQLKPKE